MTRNLAEPHLGYQVMSHGIDYAEPALEVCVCRCDSEELHDLRLCFASADRRAGVELRPESLPDELFLWWLDMRDSLESLAHDAWVRELPWLCD